MTVHCAVSLDGRHLAIRRGDSVAIHAIGADAPELGALIAETGLPATDGTLAFLGGVVVDAAVGDGRTVMTAISFPKIKKTSVELPVEVRVLADTGRYLLCAGPDVGRVVQVQGEALAYAPLRIATPLHWAVGLPDDEFLIASGRGVEVWGAVDRLPRRKLKLTVPRGLLAIGLASARNNVWMVTASPEVTVIRLSDGKTVRIPLPGVPVKPVGHPASSWLVADIDGAPHAINLVTWARETLPAGPALARAITPRGSGAVLAQIGATGGLELWELASQAPAPPPGGLTLDVADPAAPAAPPVITAPPARPRPRAPGAAALRRDVTIALLGGPGRDEPASLTRWVAPANERGLTAIAGRLRTWWLELVLDAWLAGDPAPRDRVVRQLVAEARQQVIALAGPAGPIGAVDEAGRLGLHHPLLAAQPAAPWTGVHLAAGATGVDVELDDAELATAGRALAALIGGVAETDLVSRRLHDAVRGAGLLGVPAAAPAFVGQLEPDTVATLGHCTLLANVAGAHVLVDPHLGAPTARDRGLPAPAVADLPPLAAIVLTGDDPTTLDVPTLLLLDKNVPVLIPPAPDPADRAPQLKALLSDLGFSTVRTLQPGDARSIGDGGELVALPGSRTTGGRVHGGWAARGGAGGFAATGAIPLDDADVARLAEAAAAVASRSGPLSPWFVAAPRRRRAPIEDGWRWLLEPAASWVTPRRAARPRLGALVDATRAQAVVVYGDDPAVPEDLGAAARLADCYDRYRLGAAQDGWVDPGR
jgi:hypothetical protein